MKEFMFWNRIVILFTLGVTTQVIAHDQTGTLGEDAAASDYFLVQCSSDQGGATGKLELSIYDGTTTQGGGKISAVGVFNETVATASDPNRLDDQPGAKAAVIGSNGAYNVFVHKLKNGVKNYKLTYHCKSAEGGHTGTALQTIQDQ
ncbi:hypothetical protein [Candidatus Nitrosacidococcus tergens]|uniref:Uncharacterized protein n=1 Tax=Candidatus Nitrosacidococcus tergens TaxID=553981 RepID=A0A7G1Q8B1_9GAMM|nr:hypothetical protein [Candidatus Nitrosacidococcus tergens]CAB1275102.1 conserved protein of unknown function [Candidatus Nitrosacidococcus tergens]